jgi:hypothetical protein
MAGRLLTRCHALAPPAAAKPVSTALTTRDAKSAESALPGEGHSLILAAAIVSISLNPLVFAAVDPLEQWLRRSPQLAGRSAYEGGK